jgi:CRISPR-associated exonuclease Cas4
MADGTEFLRDDEEFLSLSSLNHFLFCPRRCAMLRLEQVWADNAFTIEGTHGHRWADRGIDVQSEPGVWAVHGMLLRSRRLRLSGKADVIEFHYQADGPPVPYPVEYKRGRRRKWDNDDVQLCAQGLSLEEMLGVAVPAGAIFHIKSKRRRQVEFTPGLRTRTEEAAQRLHELIAAGLTPPPVVKPRCRGCSLREVCMPEVLTRGDRISSYLQSLFIPAKE